MVSQPFALPFWGLSFPLAAFSALSLQLANTPAYGWLQAPALVALAVASLVILGLVLGTLRGLRNGSLLAPEVVAHIAPTPSEQTAL
jgi:tellurite resistance protein